MKAYSTYKPSNAIKFKLGFDLVFTPGEAPWLVEVT